MPEQAEHYYRRHQIDFSGDVLPTGNCLGQVRDKAVWTTGNQ